ncbi:hypothetical protein EDD18DRAFT_1100580 [Armillaria luteobubalina]|uniref:Uncharacterized protein n=1 Tax=Armillaria luteobubalina TaxID=153913 RepID=A0AA39QHR5_9AGAR|nr:hypothetical protein EDD18DRAFT_1100580 [Armillaria luteobubalina]
MHQNFSQPKTIIKSLTKRLLDQALHKNNNFLALVDRSPCAYAERLYVSFMETVTRTIPRGDDDELCQELMKISELIKDITAFEDRILNAAGMGNDLGEVQQIWERMQEVERWLEDILCGTLEGMDILTKAYQDKTLLYQQHIKISTPITTLTIVFAVMSTGGSMGRMREVGSAIDIEDQWSDGVPMETQIRLINDINGLESNTYQPWKIPTCGLATTKGWGNGEPIGLTHQSRMSGTECSKSVKVLVYITEKMAPAGWCTPKQSAWFTSQLVKFHQTRLKNNVGTFLAAVVKKFMQHWPLPECTETIAGNSPEDIERRAVQNLHYQKQKEVRLFH